MDVLIVDDDHGSMAQLSLELVGRGLAVCATDSLTGAEALVKARAPRVLILAERVGGRLGHGLVLMAERRNPGLATLLLTDRVGEDLDELPDLLGSLHAILCRTLGIEALGQLALAALSPGDVVPLWVSAPTMAAGCPPPVALPQLGEGPAIAPHADRPACPPAPPVAPAPDLTAMAEVAGLGLGGAPLLDPAAAGRLWANVMAQRPLPAPAPAMVS